MDIVKHYYTYTVRAKCGISYVEVAGTKEDWVSLTQNIEPLLLALDLQDWNSELQSLLLHFIKAFDVSDADSVTHWNKIYNYHGPQGSGGVSHISGWIAHFFLYVQGKKNPLIGHLGEAPTLQLKLCDFSVGLTKTPFTWEYFDINIPMNLISGLVGVTVTVEPCHRRSVGLYLRTWRRALQHLPLGLWRLTLR